MDTLLDKKIELIRLQAMFLNEYSKTIELTAKCFFLRKDLKKFIKQAVKIANSQMKLRIIRSQILIVQSQPIKPPNFTRGGIVLPKFRSEPAEMVFAEDKEYLEKQLTKVEKVMEITKDLKKLQIEATINNLNNELNNL